MSQVRVFQCPNCKEFIATDAKACRFCKALVTQEVAQAQANIQAQENQNERRKKYAHHMMRSGVMFAIGLAITIGTLAMATASGGGNFLYGLVGWLGELGKS